jgi:transcriptional regulator with XRE-family HTH domain
VTRRRTPGLRREEVAQRARVSATWYTWLEQGRGGSPSAEVLDVHARLFLREFLADVREHPAENRRRQPSGAAFRPTGIMDDRARIRGNEFLGEQTAHREQLFRARARWGPSKPSVKNSFFVPFVSLRCEVGFGQQPLKA